MLGKCVVHSFKAEEAACSLFACPAPGTRRKERYDSNFFFVAAFYVNEFFYSRGCSNMGGREVDGLW